MTYYIFYRINDIWYSKFTKYAGVAKEICNILSKRKDIEEIQISSI